jgi:hypothetical protein
LGIAGNDASLTIRHYVIRAAAGMLPLQFHRFAKYR